MRRKPLFMGLSLSVGSLALYTVGMPLVLHNGVGHTSFNPNPPVITTQQSAPTQQALPPLPPTPPQGFNPLQATPAQLSQYGFPAKPTNPTALASWTTAMEDATTYVAPEANRFKYSSTHGI